LQEIKSEVTRLREQLRTHATHTNERFEPNDRGIPSNTLGQSAEGRAEELRLLKEREERLEVREARLVLLEVYTFIIALLFHVSFLL
jgi:hypothetical protein